MKIDSLRDLNKLILLCRKHHLNHIEVDGIKLEFGNIPVKSRIYKPVSDFKSPYEDVKVPQPNIAPELTQIDTPDELSEEQLLMWSAAGQQN